MVSLRKHATGVAAAALTAAALAGAVPAAATSTRHTTKVVIATTGDAAARHVADDLRHAGAKHVRPLPLIHGFAAEIPGAYVARLSAEQGVTSVTVDRMLKLLSVDPTLGYDVSGDEGSLYNVTRITHAQGAYTAGITGKGVDVALIDSGVAPVQGMTSGNVVNGPDLSFESQSGTLRHLDTYGHGTHMASIIAGRDVTQAATAYDGDVTHYYGVAPDARVLSVKVADHDGATDVSQVIAAIDWVVAHKNDNGMNVRVLNLSFGTDSTQPAQIDPLCFAVEQAWKRGIVVVVAGGNDGTARSNLSNPAQDPYVIAVGAEEPMNTIAVTDDTVPVFSSRGNDRRHVDVVAPGVHLLGLRVPGSEIDQNVPSARVGSRFFRGSGTSQAAAVVSGTVALMLQKWPGLTPDQVKKHLMNQATFFAGATVNDEGAGAVNARKVVANTAPGQAASAQTAYGTSYGYGSLEASRGSFHVADASGPLTGERDIFGKAFDSYSWSRASAAGTAWSGGTWNGTAWTGTGWSSDDWTGNAWTGTAWTGSSWSGNAWTDASWDGHAWTGTGWSGTGWSGSAWSGSAWTGTGWSGAAWSGTGWSASIWE
jgi:serine protease AprX